VHAFGEDEVSVRFPYSKPDRLGITDTFCSSNGLGYDEFAARKLKCYIFTLTQTVE